MKIESSQNLFGYASSLSNRLLLVVAIDGEKCMNEKGPPKAKK
jgi:hypothetical protein